MELFRKYAKYLHWATYMINLKMTTFQTFLSTKSVCLKYPLTSRIIPCSQISNRENTKA